MLSTYNCIYIGYNGTSTYTSTNTHTYRSTHIYINTPHIPLHKINNKYKIIITWDHQIVTLGSIPITPNPTINNIIKTKKKKRKKLRKGDIQISKQFTGNIIPITIRENMYGNMFKYE